MTLRQRIEPIRSRKLLDSARGQPCTLEFVGVCSHDPETTVSAHIHDEQFGKGQKADDTSTVHACDRCHMFLDWGWVGKISLELRHWHIIRAMQRTLRNRIERGLVVVPLDPERLSHDKPVKPRKPKAQRKPIQSRGFVDGPSRPIASRPFPKREKASP